MELRPNDPIAYYNLGDVLVEKQQLAEAARAYQEYMKLAEGQPDHREKIDVVQKLLAKLER